jgi:hypothetical protein
VGEVPTHTNVNAYLEQTLDALAELNDNARRLNPQLIEAVCNPPEAAALTFGNGVWYEFTRNGDYWPTPPLVATMHVNWSQWTAMSSTVQWRVSWGFDVVTVCSGASSTSSAIGLTRVSRAGHAEDHGTGAQLASASTANSTGARVHDSGWLTAPTSDEFAVYSASFETSRSGGSNGTLKRPRMFWQVRVS